LQRHYRPIIPNESGEFMGGLIRRCWSDDASTRPTFDEILREFQARQFAIFPGANPEEIRAAAEGVLQWELDARVSRA
jgi:hypothetical protein